MPTKTFMLSIPVLVDQHGLSPHAGTLVELCNLVTALDSIAAGIEGYTAISNAVTPFIAAFGFFHGANFLMGCSPNKDIQASVRDISDRLHRSGKSIFFTSTPFSTYSFNGRDLATVAGGSTVWMGVGPGTDFAFKTVLDRGYDVIDPNIVVRPLLLTHPDFMHLDTCFCLLNGGNLMWYPPAFDEHSQNTIRTWFPRAITVSDEDANNMACCAIVMDQNIITSKISDALATELASHGYAVSQIDILPHHIAAGGGCKSLVLEVG